VTVDISSPSPKWTDLVPQHERDVLVSALALKGDHLVVRYGDNTGSIRSLGQRV
jgi:hypothetical protein